MGNKNNPRHDDQDGDGIPDTEQGRSQTQAEADFDGDGAPDGETRISSNPVIINR